MDIVLIRPAIRSIIVFVLCCVFYNLAVSHLIGISFPLKQPLKPDTFLNSSILTLVSGILIAPIIEEIAARGFLSTEKKYLLCLPLLFLAIIAAFNANVFSIIVVGFLAIFFITIFLNKKYFDFVYQHYINLLIVFSCLTFSLAHVGVIEKYFSFEVALFTSIVVFFPLAYLLARVRIAYGLKYSILLHSIHNILMFSMNSLIYG